MIDNADNNNSGTDSQGRHIVGDGVRRPAFVLAADIGNSSIALGAVQGEQVFARESVSIDDTEAISGLLEQLWGSMQSPRRVVACSVNAKALARFTELVETVIDQDVVVIGDDTNLPLETTLADSMAIGRDRLCCAAAAFHKLQSPCVVVDLGTAITVDCVNSDGQFIGGAILPGMKMQLDSLRAGTTALPQLELSEPTGFIGTDTQQAMLVGVIAGVRGAVRSLVEAYATELGTWPVVITTGGDSELFGNPEEIVQARVEALSLLGIAQSFYASLSDFPQ